MLPRIPSPVPILSLTTTPTSVPTAVFSPDASAEILVADGTGPRARWTLGAGKGTEQDWATAGATFVRALVDKKLRTVQVHVPGDVKLAAFVRGLSLGGYLFSVGEKANRTLPAIKLIVEHVTDELALELEHSSVSARATALARDLANAPSNVKTPDWLATTAAKISAGHDGLSTVIRDEKWLADNGFGGILAVGAGSATPPRLIHMSWQPKHADEHGKHIVLVGKGITFDTGGLSLKPAEGMHLMRTDMSGGAAVIAALRAIAELNLPIKVTGLVAAAENHVSGSSYRPADIVRHYDGTTTEVGNTDAEGRMVLADALGYARLNLKPDVLVDVATLTGAMKVALGMRTGGFFATNDDLARRVVDAGKNVGEPWWRMPLDDLDTIGNQLVDAVTSEIADLRQAANGPGSITAALFLKAFVGDVDWAHLDIAGPARSETTYAEVVPQATGFAARTLVDLVANLVLGESSVEHGS